MRLIDADKLVAELQKKPIHDGHFIHTRDVSDAIFNAPTISPDEVRGVGKWKEIEVMPKAYDICGVETWASKMQCCNCGFTTFAIGGHFSQYNYCPSCGARLGNGGTDDS